LRGGRCLKSGRWRVQKRSVGRYIKPSTQTLPRAPGYRIRTTACRYSDRLLGCVRSRREEEHRKKGRLAFGKVGEESGRPEAPRRIDPGMAARTRQSVQGGGIAERRHGRGPSKARPPARQAYRVACGARPRRVAIRSRSSSQVGDITVIPLSLLARPCCPRNAADGRKDNMVSPGYVAGNSNLPW